MFRVEYAWLALELVSTAAQQETYEILVIKYFETVDAAMLKRKAISFKP